MFFLKLLKESMFLMVSERLFHNFGAATENDLSPYALVLAIGVCKRFFCRRSQHSFRYRYVG